MDDRTMGRGADDAAAGEVPAEVGGGGQSVASGRPAWTEDLWPLAAAAFDAALEAIGAPAFLVRAPATVLRANARGAALLASDPARVEVALRGGGPRGPRRYAVGASDRFLAVLPEARPDAGARAPALASSWRLTPRQTAVLALVADGHTNRSVAGQLGCSEKTVELHVSALLAKTRRASRAQLVAAFWTDAG